MALFPLINCGNPYGIFDGYDALASTMLGGEVAHLVSYSNAGADKHAKDIDDGYVIQGPPTNLQVRPVVSLTYLTGQNADNLFLCDEGTTNYGTMFGVVVGGTAGQVVNGGTQLGPHTMTGSGKVTLWQNTGMYGVTLDAVDTANDGLVSSNNALTINTKLTFGANGKLTPVGSTLAAAFPGGANTVAAARLAEFSTGDTLVTTPHNLTRLYTAGGTLAFKYAVINWL